MKIAFITHYTDLYGANRSLLSLIDGLNKHNVKSHVVIPQEGEIVGELNDRQIPFVILPVKLWVSPDKTQCYLPQYLDRFLRRKYNALNHLWQNILILPSLIKHLIDWDIDLLYTNSGVTPIGAMAAKYLKIPHIWHLREFIDLDYNYHHDFGKAIFHYFVSKADAQIVVSKAIGRYFFGNSPPKTLHNIYDGIALIAQFDRLDRQAQTEIYSDNIFRFAIVGRIRKQKGQMDAIKAFAELAKYHSEVRLLVVGDGNIEAARSLVRELNIENKVEFWGYTKDVDRAYMAADAVLVCSANEAMGRVTIEAMATRRPVIGYDNAGTSELIEHEKTGLLCQSNYQELAKYMRMIVENREWSRQMAHNAFFFARNNFNTELYAQSVYEVIQDSLS